MLKDSYLRGEDYVDFKPLIERYARRNRTDDIITIYKGKNKSGSTFNCT